MSLKGAKAQYLTMDEVKKEFETYRSAHNHYIGQFQPGERLIAEYYNNEPVNFEEAKPFIRAMVERMLDLMATEENWVKKLAHDNKNGVQQWCLIGAMGQAKIDLGLAENGEHQALDEARRRVCAAIEMFMTEAVAEDTGFTSMPSFNDAAATTFEDVRLWLKRLFDKLD